MLITIVPEIWVNKELSINFVGYISKTMAEDSNLRNVWNRNSNK